MKQLMIILLTSLFLGQIFAQGELFINEGAHIISTGHPNIVLNNVKMINDGAVKAAKSTVTFTGDAATESATISGFSKTTFHHLVLDKVANDLRLETDIAVSGDLTFEQGNLDLSEWKVDLGETGTLHKERAESKATSLTNGTIRKTVNLDQPTTINPGNLRIDISADTDLGQTIVHRGHQTNADGTAQLYFNIETEQIHPSKATIAIHYFDNEIGGLAKEDLAIWKTKKQASWNYAGVSSNDPTDNEVVLADIALNNRFTIGAEQANFSSNPSPTKTLVKLADVAKQAHLGQIAPNPVVSQATVPLTIPKSTKTAHLIITTSDGKVMDELKIQQRGEITHTYDTAALTAGVYFYSLAIDHQVIATKQLIKIK